MQILAQLRQCFVQPLTDLFQEAAIECNAEVLASALSMIRPAQNAQFGDYQANFAMPLSKTLGQKSNELAAEIVKRSDLSSVCERVEVAGPGFINLTLKPEFLLAEATRAFTAPDLQDTDLHAAKAANVADAPASVDHRSQPSPLGIETPDDRHTIVVDFSSPNVAKPMHVGHIRSTFIGDALAKVCRYLGHQVITDNHLGDWGTQFGMIIYGMKHFADPVAYKNAPVAELSRLYRQVRRLIDVIEKTQALPQLQTQKRLLEEQCAGAKQIVIQAESQGDKKALKTAKQNCGQFETKLQTVNQEIHSTEKSLADAQADPTLQTQLAKHANIATEVLQETSRLHAGDAANLKLWEEVQPHCHDEIDRVYRRLDIRFDHCLGESFYHPQLLPLVEKLEQQGLLKISDGAQCVFLENFDAPMIVRKRDGAFLYATTDLATIEYRMQHWQPDVMLYVVDHRQKEHFDKLFAVADKMGYQSIKKVHVSFGTVMGPDGKPYKTRSGDTIGLEGLIDEAVAKAREVVSAMDDAKANGPEFDQAARDRIAEVVGVGALKYGDLSQNRSSDYKFDFDQMVALDGNTATYLQYGYARVNGIFSKVGITPQQLRDAAPSIQITNDAERSLILAIIRFQDALEEVLVDYRPNILCGYLYELTREFFSFYNRKDCHVDGAPPAIQHSRLALCDLVARTVKTGLSLLGIGVVEKM